MLCQADFQFQPDRGFRQLDLSRGDHHADEHQLRSGTGLVACLLYTSDAADDGESVDLGGRRIIKKNFFKQKTAYEIMPSLVGSEMCIRDSYRASLAL